MLYFNLLGTLQFFGIHINAVTYVTVVIAIGLLVDFLMHILLRYYESPGATREAKVIETLETMGASMLMGGFTTWLGVIPLALSATEIFNTIVSSKGCLKILSVFIFQLLVQALSLICMIHSRQVQFVAFMAMVSWGLMTSLVLMPVILSMWGPVVCTVGDRLSKKEAKKIKKSQILEKLTTISPPALQRSVNSISTERTPTTSN